jgi:hypothetical protein
MMREKDGGDGGRLVEADADVPHAVNTTEAAVIRIQHGRGGR